MVSDAFVPYKNPRRPIASSCTDYFSTTAVPLTLEIGGNQWLTCQEWIRFSN